MMIMIMMMIALNGNSDLKGKSWRGVTHPDSNYRLCIVAVPLPARVIIVSLFVFSDRRRRRREFRMARVGFSRNEREFMTQTRFRNGSF